MAAALAAETAITINGIQCWDEGTREKIGRTQSAAVRTLVCKWTDRVALTKFFRGGSAVVGGVTIYGAGAAYPDWQLYCDDVDIAGVVGAKGMTNAANDLIAYDYARLTVTYTSLQYSFDASAMNADLIGIDYGVELIHCRQTASVLKFAGGADLPAEDNPPIPNPLITYTVPLRNLPALPKAAIRAAADAPVNSVACLGCPPGTLMFSGGKAAYGFNAGRIAWAFDLSLVYKGSGWNKILTDTGFQNVVRKSGGQPMILTSDLNALLPDTAGKLNTLLA